MSKPILLAGATGLFGGHLANRLIADGYDVICVGRDKQKLEAYCNAQGGRPYALDLQDSQAVETALQSLKPFCVIDCAGPFQNYAGYGFAEAVLKSGANYLDIADATEFVNGISALDGLAKEQGLVALSGASSTPALAAAVADELTAGLDHVESIESAIVPGNKTKRGYSVVQAILSQVGQKFLAQRHGAFETAIGWTDTRHIDLSVEGEPKIRSRLASLVDTPDRLIFPDRYKAQTVSFRAGLELKFFHRVLQLMHYPVRWGLLKSLSPLAKFGYNFSRLFERIGSDYGGMKVDVVGRQGDQWTRKIWDLIAADGHGPKIPVQPVIVALRKMEAGGIAAGARPCVGEISLTELEAEMAKFGAQSQRHEQNIEPIFKAALGESFAELPKTVRDLHGRLGRSVFEGEVVNSGPSNIFGKIAAWIGGFSSKVGKFPARVTIDADENEEIWQRDFDGTCFSSNLTPNPKGGVTETFGPLSFHIALAREGEMLAYPVVSGKLWKTLPVPKFLLPRSVSFEGEDQDGNFTFDVHLSLPIGGRIAHYKGTLKRLV